MADECGQQQNPRIKKFLNGRRRESARIRSLHKFCEDETVTPQQRSIFFHVYYAQVFECLLAAVKELDIQASDHASQAHSVFDVFKKDRNVKFDDYVYIMNVMKQLVFNERERFREGWRAEGLRRFITQMISPRNEPNFRVLGLDLLLLTIDIMRPSRANKFTSGSGEGIFTKLLSCVVDEKLLIDVSQSITLPPGQAAASTLDTSDSAYSHTLTIWKSHLHVFAVPSSHYVATTESVIKLGRRILNFCGVPNHRELTEDDVDRLQYWYDIALRVVTVNVFPHLSNLVLLLKTHNKNTNDSGKSLLNQEARALPGHLDSSAGASKSQIVYSAFAVGLRAEFLDWVVKNLFRESFSNILFRSPLHGRLLFEIFDTAFPKIESADDEAIPDWGTAGQVQIQILMWYVSLFSSNRQEEVRIRFLNDMLKHAACAIQARGVLGYRYEEAALVAINFLEECLKGGYNGEAFPNEMWPTLKNQTLQAVVALSRATDSVDDSILSFCFAARLAIGIWIQCPDQSNESWSNLQSHGVDILHNSSTIAVWGDFVKSITEYMLECAYKKDETSSENMTHDTQHRRNGGDGGSSEVNLVESSTFLPRRRPAPCRTLPIQSPFGRFDQDTLSSNETAVSEGKRGNSRSRTGSQQSANRGHRSSIAKMRSRPRTSSLLNVRTSIPGIVFRVFEKFQKQPSTTSHHSNLNPVVHSIHLWHSLMRLVSLGSYSESERRYLCCVSSDFHSLAVRNAIFNSISNIVHTWIATIVKFPHQMPPFTALLKMAGPWLLNACADRYHVSWKDGHLDKRYKTFKATKTSDETIDTGTQDVFRALTTLLKSYPKPRAFGSRKRASTSSSILQGFELLHVGLGATDNGDSSARIVWSILFHGATLLSTGLRGISILLPSFLCAIQSVYHSRYKRHLSGGKTSIRSGAKEDSVMKHSVEERSAVITLLTSMISSKCVSSAPSLALWSKVDTSLKTHVEGTENFSSKSWYVPVPYFMRQMSAVHLLLSCLEEEEDVHALSQCIYSLSLALHHMNHDLLDSGYVEREVDRVCNVENVIFDQCLRSELLLFCELEYSSENLEFCLAVNKFLAMVGAENNGDQSRRENFELPRDSKFIKVAEQIVHQFIGSNAAQEINLPSKISDPLLKRASNGEFSVDMFADAQQEIFHLLRKDTMPRFRNHIKMMLSTVHETILNAFLNRVKAPFATGNRKSNIQLRQADFLPSISATFAISSLCFWSDPDNKYDFLRPSSFVPKLSSVLKEVAVKALASRCGEADTLIIHILRTLEKWIFARPTSGSFIMVKDETIGSVFEAIEATLCFACRDVFVSESTGSNSDHERVDTQGPDQDRLSGSSPVLVRVLNLLKQSPRVMAKQFNTSHFLEKKPDLPVVNGSDLSNNKSCRLSPSFIVAETLVIHLQRHLNMFPGIYGPGCYESAMSEYFFKPETKTASVDSNSSNFIVPSIIFGFRSRIFSLSEIPPDEQIGLSRVRLVVRDTTGRYCWDLIPTSADPMGSNAVLVPKVPVNEKIDTTKTDPENVDSTRLPVTLTQESKPEESIHPEKVQKAAMPQVGEDVENPDGQKLTLDNLEKSDEGKLDELPSEKDNESNNYELEANLSSLAIPQNGTDRLDDLLLFIKNNGDIASTCDSNNRKQSQISNPPSHSSTSERFLEFVKDADPSNWDASASKKSMQDECKVQLLADEVSGVASLNSTTGSELGCKTIEPVIQPSSLTEMDRCRQILAQVRIVLNCFRYCFEFLKCFEPMNNIVSIFYYHFNFPAWLS